MLRLLQGSTVQVDVGAAPDHETYHIHKALLCAYSDYFDRALNAESTFTESTSQLIYMEEEDPVIFSIVNFWLYAGVIRLPPQHTRPRDIQMTLLKLWLFADCRLMPALQNHALDFLHQSVIDLWDFGDSLLIGTIFTEAPREAGICDWVVECFATFADAARLEKYLKKSREYGDEYPPSGFSYRLAKRLLRNVEETPRSLDFIGLLKNMDVCQFHEHSEDENCKLLAELDLKQRNDSSRRGVKRAASGIPNHRETKRASN